MKPTPAKRAKPAPETSGPVPLVSRQVSGHAPRLPPRNMLRLFVAGATDGSRQAILRVRELCVAEPAGSCTLEVIDIYQQPELARTHQIVATPTLIKDLPAPSRRFIGSMTNVRGLFAAPGVVAARKGRR